MTIESRSRRYSSALLERVARRLMSASPLCSLATVSPGGRAHVNHMYFARNDRYEVFWYSDRGSVHSRNLGQRPTAAITIYDSHQTYGLLDRGIQLFGVAAIATGRDGEEALRIYRRRFRGVDPSAHTADRFRPRTVKIFDERAIAPAMLVSARVTPAGLAWVKTEVWVV